MTTSSASTKENIAAASLKFEDLLTEQLQGVDGTEVVVSITTVPPHTTLPRHWHPGEEFAYVLEGSFTLHQEGKPDKAFRKGDVGVVPLKAVHTISTRDEGATALIFRVHEAGQPGRILVDDKQA
jgi:quercetin dioxygenase-like cupin family protein